MDSLALVVGNVLGVSAFIGGIALCVRFDQQGKTRRRELEHVERMKAHELGRPLDDAAVARFKALGAVGVAVPIVTLSAATMLSVFLLLAREFEGRLLAFVVVWLVCGVVCLAVLPVVGARLREHRPRSAMEKELGDPRDRSTMRPED